MHKYTFLFICFLSLTIALSAENNIGSKKDTVKFSLSEIVVTATKIATPNLEIASSVTVLNEEDIQKSNKSFVSEILKEVPGLDIVQQGGSGKFTSIFLRGANSSHTLVLIDGIEMNNPSANNSYDIANLPAANIERIEILRGPQSTLYGSDAMAGVISIFTKKGEGKPQAYLSLEGGSFKTYSGSTGLNGEHGIFNYSLNYSHLSSGGFSTISEKYGNTEKDSYLNNSVLSQVGVKLNKEIDFRLTYKFNKSKTDLDQYGKTGDDPNYKQDLEESGLRAAVNASLFNGTWEQNLSASQFRYINNTTDEIDELNPFPLPGYLTAKKVKFDWQNIIRLGSHTKFLFGVETENERTNIEKEATTSSVYFQDQINILNSFFASAGIRYDKHSKFGNVITYRFAPAYYLKSTATKFKATYGTGFKSPSLYYLFDPAFGNPELKPEKSRGWDAGFEQYLFNYTLTLGVSYFSNFYDNLIGFDSNFKTINVDNAETKGLEFIIQTAPFYNISLNANYTFTSSKDKSEGKEDSGKDLLRRPANKFTINLAYKLGGAGFNLEIINVGKREDKDFSTWPAERIELKSYTLINLAANYNLFNNLNLYGKIDNLFDTNYEEVLFYGTTGLSGRIGLKIIL